MLKIVNELEIMGENMNKFYKKSKYFFDLLFTFKNACVILKVSYLISDGTWLPPFDLCAEGMCSDSQKKYVVSDTT